MGGGFGGKTGFYPEPIAIQLSRKAKRPVKITLTRNEVFRATGPGVRHQVAHQDRLQEGRHHHGGRSRADLPDRPVHGVCVHQCAAGDVHALCTEERQDGLLRGGVEPPEGELVPRALRAAGRVRRRGRDLRARRQDRHGRDRLPAEERRGRRLQDHLRRRVRPDRLRRDAGGREEVRPLHLAGAGRLRAAASPPASGSTAAARPPAR